MEEDDDAFGATRRYLDEMDQDYADLTLIHRPPQDGVGEELWKDLIRARSDGMTRDIGVSNYTIAQMQELADATGDMPVVNQIEWTPFGWSRDMLEFCRALRFDLSMDDMSRLDELNEQWSALGAAPQYL